MHCSGRGCGGRGTRPATRRPIGGAEREVEAAGRLLQAAVGGLDRGRGGGRGGSQRGIGPGDEQPLILGAVVVVCWGAVPARTGKGRVGTVSGSHPRCVGSALGVTLAPPLPSRPPSLQELMTKAVPLTAPARTWGGGRGWGSGS